MEKEIKTKTTAKTNIEIIKDLIHMIYPETSQYYEALNEGLLATEGRCIILYFSEFTITNKYKQTHNIVDLFLKINLRSNGTIYNDIKGTRATVSYAEYVSKYKHSHMRTGNDIAWKKCCLGGGTSLNQNVTMLKSEFNPIIFEAMLYQFYDYVRWESREGGPYIRMEKIKMNRSQNNLVSYIPKNIINNIIPFIDINRIKIVSKCIYDTISYDKIISPSNLEEFENLKSYFGGILHQLGYNEYLEPNDIINETEILKKITDINNNYRHEILIKFRGIDFKYKILPIEKTIHKAITYKMDRYNCNIILDYLQYCFDVFKNHKKLKNEYTKRLHSPTTEQIDKRNK